MKLDIRYSYEDVDINALLLADHTAKHGAAPDGYYWEISKRYGVDYTIVAAANPQSVPANSAEAVNDPF